jgi:hypothetical protein
MNVNDQTAENTKTILYLSRFISLFPSSYFSFGLSFDLLLPDLYLRLVSYLS